MANLWIKDDGVNPAGSSEARSFSCAISMAVELNLRKVAASLDGPGGAALAAYAAAAGIAARISLPEDAPQAAFVACVACGAEVALGEAWPALDGWFDLGAFAEPYRVEGLKTLGYEIAEQLRWDVPEAILCPVGRCPATRPMPPGCGPRSESSNRGSAARRYTVGRLRLPGRAP